MGDPQVFLKELEKTGLVRPSALAAGFSNSREVHELRRTSRDFEFGWNAARERFQESLEAKALHHALIGPKQWIFRKGKVVGEGPVPSRWLAHTVFRDKKVPFFLKCLLLWWRLLDWIQRRVY